MSDGVFESGVKNSNSPAKFLSHLQATPPETCTHYPDPDYFVSMELSHKIVSLDKALVCAAIDKELRMAGLCCLSNTQADKPQNLFQECNDTNWVVGHKAVVM